MFDHYNPILTYSDFYEKRILKKELEMMVKKPKRWVWDLDDTTWMNVWQYDLAYADFFQYLYRTLRDKMPGFDFTRERLREIENLNAEEFGVRKGRVAESMLQLYSEICRYIEVKYGFNPCGSEDKGKIAEIGDEPFQFTRLKWLDHAKLVLNYLKSSNADELYFLTNCDRQVFPDKARFLKLYSYFKKGNGLVVETKKTKHDFVQVSGWTPELDSQFDWYAVGNGESDIVPALEISENWRGFYIPHGTTSPFFNQDGSGINFIPGQINHGRVTTLKDIKKILEHV